MEPGSMRTRDRPANFVRANFIRVHPGGQVGSARSDPMGGAPELDEFFFDAIGDPV